VGEKRKSEKKGQAASDVGKTNDILTPLCKCANFVTNKTKWRKYRCVASGPRPHFLHAPSVSGGLGSAFYATHI